MEEKEDISLSDNVKYESCGCFKGTYIQGICRHCMSSIYWEGKWTYFFIQKYIPNSVKCIYTSLDL